MLMGEILRRERVKKYGSFMYCPKKDTLCERINNDKGVCDRDVCLHDDPEYIALQKRIEENRKKNAMLHEQAQAKKLEERAEKKMMKKRSPYAPNRIEVRASNEERELLIRIARMKNAAERAYTRNRPKEGEAIEFELMHLEGRLRALREKQ